MRIDQQPIKQLDSLRESTSFAHRIKIRRPGQDLDHIIDWCKTECCNDWRWQLIATSSQFEYGEYQFYFDSEQDFLAFTIKWA